MSTVPVQRWAVSFADLGLLLLGCFVLLHAMESARPKAGAGATSVAREAGGYRAAALFQPGEAVLKPEARASLQAEGRRRAGHPLRIVSQGAAESGGRLDRFELSAARAAAVGRALREGGLAEGHLTIAVADTDAGVGQTIAVVQR
jgi:flagellar motor protein MotB